MQRDRRAVYQKKKKEATLVTRLGDNAVVASDSLGIMQCEQMKRQEKRATSILTPIAEERVNRNDRGKARHDEYRIKRRQNKNTSPNNHLILPPYLREKGSPPKFCFVWLLVTRRAAGLSSRLKPPRPEPMPERLGE